MEFQFPANPAVGDTVVNPTTGTTYIWSDPPGRWSIQTISDVNSITVFEGDAPPPAASGYQLWFDTLSNSLKYYYCSPDGDCKWITTAFNEEGVETVIAQLTEMSNAIIELQSKVTTLENTFFLILE